MEIDYIRYEFFPACFLGLIASALLENLLQRSGAETEDFDLVPDGGSFLETNLSEETLQQMAMNEPCIGCRRWRRLPGQP